MHVPTHYWSDATLIACYLINRTPSSVSNKQIAHEVLFPNNPCSMSLLIRYLVALVLCTTWSGKGQAGSFSHQMHIFGTHEFRKVTNVIVLHYANACVSPYYLFLNLFLSFLSKARLFNLILQLSMSITTSFQFSRYCCCPPLLPPIFTFTAVAELHAPPSSTSISPYSCLHLLPF